MKIRKFIAKLRSLLPEIVQPTAPQSLDLSGNQLSALPPEIGRLTALQDLDLRGNRLRTLPPEIGQLTALQALHLDETSATRCHGRSNS